jgi:pyruvate/2-oxoglutarate dehydrogenase complex dihydrolipoamide acyltransferase (E2) component
VPAPKTATPPAPAQARAPVPAAPQQAAPAAQPQESAPAPAAPKDQGSEWQTAETKRQSRVPPVVAATPEKEGTMAYIKYVTDKVDAQELEALLTGYGELAYFDINRAKV